MPTRPIEIHNLSLSNPTVSVFNVHNLLCSSRYVTIQHRFEQLKQTSYMMINFVVNVDKKKHKIISIWTEGKIRGTILSVNYKTKTFALYRHFAVCLCFLGTLQWQCPLVLLQFGSKPLFVSQWHGPQVGDPHQPLGHWWSILHTHSNSGIGKKNCITISGHTPHISSLSGLRSV